MHRSAQCVQTALPQLGLPSSCAPAQTGVVTVVRKQLLQRQWPFVVIRTPGTFDFTAAAICLPFPAVEAVLPELCRSFVHNERSCGD
jgi:hypothetical protein